MKRFFALALLFFGSAAYAAAPASAPTASPDAVTDDAVAPDSKLSINAEADFTTAYMFRGYNNGDSGLIFQPTITAGYTLVDNPNGLKITPHLNLWANITDKSYNHLDYWDELDIVPGVDFISGRFTFTAEYLAYYSPANNFGTTHEIGGILAFDDSGLTKLPFAVNPTVAIYQELRNPNKGHEGTYFELGVEPEFDVQGVKGLSFSTPIKFGGGFSQYYTHANGRNAVAGYAQGGIAAKYQINDHFYFKVEADYYQLLSQSTILANDGRDNKVVGTIGIGYDF